MIGNTLDRRPGALKMQKTSYRKSPLATGVALALGAVSIAPALAQDNAGQVIEEITVTGIRGSLTQSANIKRRARGVVRHRTAAVHPGHRRLRQGPQ